MCGCPCKVHQALFSRAVHGDMCPAHRKNYSFLMHAAMFPTADSSRHRPYLSIYLTLAIQQGGERGEGSYASTSLHSLLQSNPPQHMCWCNTHGHSPLHTLVSDLLLLVTPQQQVVGDEPGGNGHNAAAAATAEI